jgi:hypothetical protein
MESDIVLGQKPEIYITDGRLRHSFEKYVNIFLLPQLRVIAS